MSIYTKERARFDEWHFDCGETHMVLTVQNARSVIVWVFGFGHQHAGLTSTGDGWTWLYGADDLPNAVRMALPALLQRHGIPAVTANETSIDVMTRALAESRAERDRLAEQLRKTRDELEIQRQWCPLDTTVHAVLVLCDVEQNDGQWDVIVRDREKAERLADLVENDDDEIWCGRGLVVLEGAVPVAQGALWNSYSPARLPRGDQ